VAAHEVDLGEQGRILRTVHAAADLGSGQEEALRSGQPVDRLRLPARE